jgi:hypothetical protein
VGLFAAAPRILRFAPDRRVRVVQNRSCDFVEPTETQIEIRKLLKDGGLPSPGIPSPPRFWQ